MRLRIALVGALALTIALGSCGHGVRADESGVTPLVTESYYRIRWGDFDEFMELFKRNHFPILKRLKELGHIRSMNAAFPINHGGEDSRWDWRMTIVIADRSGLDAFEEAFAKVSIELYPDQQKLKQEERRRFSLLTEHMDVQVTVDDLSSW